MVVEISLAVVGRNTIVREIREKFAGVVAV